MIAWGGVMAAQVGDAGNISINVDIHCHMFNATDIPINGFVRHVTANGRRLRQRYAGLGLTAPSWLGTEAG